MSYKDKYGITTINDDNWDNLQISWDYDEDDPQGRYVVLLYTPNMDHKIEHYHIPLEHAQAKTLYKWLGAYLKDAE